MLNGTGQQMTRRLPAQAEQGEIVSFGSAASEDHYLSSSTEMGGDGFAGIFESAPRLPADGMSAGGIAERLCEIRPHGLPHSGQQRCGGVVVEINAIHTQRRQRIENSGRATRGDPTRDRALPTA